MYVCLYIIEYEIFQKDLYAKECEVDSLQDLISKLQMSNKTLQCMYL